MSKHSPGVLDSVYQQLVLEHNRNPVGFGVDADAPYQVTLDNPTCGDRICLHAHIDQATGKLLQIGFSDENCAICTASASLMCQQINELVLNEAVFLAKQFNEFIDQGHSGQWLPNALQPLEVFTQLQHIPMRKNCAKLPWEALLELAENVTKNHKDTP